MSIKRFITQNSYNIPGWCTNRHIVVIESDDWGSIRMPSKEVYQKLLTLGYRVDQHPYEKNDSLETEDDLTALYGVLSKYTDKKGCHPVITTNFVVANPDFKSIEDDNFREYKYELITDTYKKYSGCSGSFGLIQEGIANGLIKAQLHGREHVNAIEWMRQLQSNNQDSMNAFRYEIAALTPKTQINHSKALQVALRDCEGDIHQANQLITEANLHFEALFGYHSDTFIAPCFTWGDNIEKALLENGNKCLQGGINQLFPDGRRKRHFMGTKNGRGMLYLFRNCALEMTTNHSSADTCLNEIRTAFFWRKPAVITSHRINYIGSLQESNRGKNLLTLDETLRQILKTWPDVEFLTSDQLYHLIINK